MTPEPDLADFLLARIAEDEEAAREAADRIAELDGMWDADDPDRWEWAAWSRPGASFVASGAVPAHIARHDPARVLAECESKRRIVNEVVGDIDSLSSQLTEAVEVWDPSPSEDLLKLLASPYADHPNFREEWRP